MSEEKRSREREIDRDKRKIFEQIKTPQKLLAFMEENVEYGFVGKNNRKKYTGEFEGKDMDEEYFLQDPAELIESGVGVCWDTTELERHWFEKNGYECKTFFLFFDRENLGDLPTHTFLVYKQEDKWVWFEYSFGMHRGLHEYESLKGLVADVMKKQFEYARMYCEATEEDEKYLRNLEFETPKFGCTAQEFVERIMSRRKESVNESV